MRSRVAARYNPGASHVHPIASVDVPLTLDYDLRRNHFMKSDW